MMLNKKLVSGTVLATVMLGGVSSTAFASNATTAPSNTAITNAFHKQGPKLDTAKLAKELGVSEAKLKTALETVHKEMPKPSKPTGTPPKGHAKFEDDFAAKLAKALGLSTDKVKAALDNVLSAAPEGASAASKK